MLLWIETAHNIALVRDREKLCLFKISVVVPICGIFKCRANSFPGHTAQRCARINIMPVPNFYTQVSKKYLLKKWPLLFLTGIGVVVCFLSIIISVKYQRNLFSLFGMGMLLIIWGWGLFLVGVWYGKPFKKVGKVPKIFFSSDSWASSIFLDIWFAVGSLAIILFIFNSI